jgi:hypothetical protein
MCEICSRKRRDVSFAQNKNPHMKKILTLTGCCMLLACSEPFELSKNAQGVPAAGNATTQDIGPAPVPSYAWRSVTLPVLQAPYPNNNLTGKMETIVVNGDAYWFFGSFMEFTYKLNKATGRWEKYTGPYLHNMFQGGYKHLFSYGTRYYYGFRSVGDDPGVIYYFDIATGQGGHLPDFPGTLTDEATFFVAGDRAYIMGGRRGNTISAQLWEFNFATNVWTNKGGLPGGARADAVAHVIDDKVYFGLGYDLIYGNGQWVKIYKNDWYSMTPGGNGGFAAVRANFPGAKRAVAEGFVIKNKIYVGWGRSIPGEYLNDFWEYNTSNNTWTQRPECPASNLGPEKIDVFAIGDNGYFIKGWLGVCKRWGTVPLIGPVGG